MSVTYRKFSTDRMKSHLEARLWNDIFVRAQQQVNIAVGTIKATVLVETILAAFEVDEIIAGDAYEEFLTLRAYDHLN